MRAEPSASASTRARGDRVEDGALAFLLQHGLLLVERNVSARGGELDLVMRQGDTLVFIEVRHRATHAFGGGGGSVDARKRAKLVLAASAYLADHPALADAPCRFDVIEGSGDASSPRLHWIRDAFRADEC